MKYLKTYEAKKKTEDPLYHLAVAMRDYLSYSITTKGIPDGLQPIIKYYYTSIRIINKTNILNYVSIVKSKSKTIQYFNILMNSDSRDLFNKIFKKYKVDVYMEADRYSYADVENMIDDINMELAAIKYNL